LRIFFLFGGVHIKAYPSLKSKIWVVFYLLYVKAGPRIPLERKGRKKNKEILMAVSKIQRAFDFTRLITASKPV